VTYCVGWIQGKSVFLAADTAVTSASRPRNTHSSVGELHDRVRDDYVEENLLKIVPIGDGTAAAYAGQVGLCHAIVWFLSQNFSPTESIATLVQRMIASIGPFDTSDEGSLLIARSTLDGGPELYRWTSGQSKLESGDSFYSIGSMATYRDYTPKIVDILPMINATGHRALTSMTALIQSFGVHENMIQQNIGGAIFGLMSTEGAIEWQRDTALMIYDDENPTAIRVKLAAIDNGLIISSSATKENRALLGFVDGDVWSAKHGAEVERRIHDVPARQWVFLHSQRWLITIVDGEPGSSHPVTDFVFLSPDGRTFSIESRLLEILKRDFPGPSSNPYFYFFP